MTSPLDQSDIIRRYDRVARVYRFFEPLFLIRPRTRRAAVAALALQPGDTVLELGVGTGRNLTELVAAVGPHGRVIGVDAAPKMLAEARRLADRHPWPNVKLIQADAATIELQDSVDGVLFSLSYSVIPNATQAVHRAWAQLRPGRRLVIMDAGLTHSRLAPLLRGFVRVLVRLGPGNPQATPWSDLRELGAAETHWLLGGLYYICTWLKPPADLDQ